MTKTVPCAVCGDPVRVELPDDPAARSLIPNVPAACNECADHTRKRRDIAEKIQPIAAALAGRSRPGSEVPSSRAAVQLLILLRQYARVICDFHGSRMVYDVEPAVEAIKASPDDVENHLKRLHKAIKEAVRQEKGAVSGLLQ